MHAPPVVALGKYIANGEYVTDYAASEWVDNKDRETACAELFAEAYSLWLTNRDYMTKNHPKMAAWFASQQF